MALTSPETTRLKYANQVRDEYPDKDKVEFSVGDVRKIDFKDNKFDVTYTTRVIINLPAIRN